MTKKLLKLLSKTDGIITPKEIDEFYGECLERCISPVYRIIPITYYSYEWYIFKLYEAYHIVKFLIDKEDRIIAYQVYRADNYTYAVEMVLP